MNVLSSLIEEVTGKMAKGKKEYIDYLNLVMEYEAGKIY